MRLLSAFISPPYIRPARFRTTMTLGAFDLSSSLPVSAVGDTVSAWSVAGSTIDAADIASSLFESSLLPYLILLYFLSRTETNTPKLANFGFQFLLVFVFATIPAGIYAKIHYQDILANVDWLHGFAESFLTLTNLFIIAGFRRTRLDPPVDTKSIALNSSAIPIAFLLTALSTASFIHPEPLNALSIPTWIVHTSSLLEWLVAMKLIWEHADTSGNPRWKGMTLAMIPSHTSGICACTFHFFYNTPVLNWIVALQAALTVLGNSTMALAAYRIYQYAKETTTSPDTFQALAKTTTTTTTAAIIDTEPGSLPMPVPVEARAGTPKPLEESAPEFALNMIVKSVALAVGIKYGELLLDIPFQPSTSAAAVLIAAPTLANVAKWAARSMDSSESASSPTAI